MKKILLGLVLVFSIGCGGTQTVVLEPRFSLVSETSVTAWDKITVIRDNVTGRCMATYVNGGVMSWPTVCNQQEYDQTIERLNRSLQEQNPVMEGMRADGQN